MTEVAHDLAAAHPLPRRLVALLKPHHVPLGRILALAACLDFWSLSQNGYANTYYSGAVRSMLQSWHNFFFVSFDPGGLVSVDKPPLALWLQAASAKAFGFSSSRSCSPRRSPASARSGSSTSSSPATSAASAGSRRRAGARRLARSRSRSTGTTTPTRCSRSCSSPRSTRRTGGRVWTAALARSRRPCSSASRSTRRCSPR